MSFILQLFTYARDKRIRKCELANVRADEFGGVRELDEAETLETLVRELVNVKIINARHANAAGGTEPTGDEPSAPLSVGIARAEDHS